MIKKIAWEAFKNTGDINTYLELKQIEQIEKGIEEPKIDIFQNEIENNINKKQKRKGEIN